MRTVEVVSILAAVFLVTLSVGDGAPQWRPQGRFGKRLDSRAGLLSALRSVSDDTEQLEPLFMEDLDDADNIDIYNNLPASRASSPRVCIETNFPGVFRCHRRRRSDTGLHEEE